MLNTIKIGEKEIESLADLFSFFYIEKYILVNWIRSRTKGKMNVENAEDIFEETLFLLAEKYYTNQGKRDYAELRKLFYGIAKIKVARFVSQKNSEESYNWSQSKRDIHYNRFQIWFRDYYRKYTEKNREKIRERNRTPKYRLLNAKRQKKYRSKKIYKKENVKID